MICDLKFEDRKHFENVVFISNFIFLGGKNE